ncbi:hypothetical protein BTA51_09125 [Hahella sp. CCB-MM4]|uniref:hypothetical protein n=1 Tax=Hahella sp. (strain CCB-MM4) TaxID=1926491 RepID=UPI000B9AAA64|nr:hypothetical protein [Hahella sp. CCB-MM4]OZG73932.1 hypothetical protein BTA51_09125 [Hahella sp. CCB-MM4]
MYLRTLVILLIALASSLAQAEEWFAMERHGDCYRLADMNDHIYVFKGTKTPEEMEEKLKAERVEYTIEPLKPGMEGVLKVNVPRENIAMLIVTKKYCKVINEH